MPINRDIKKVLVIGSGPIIIGQAAEFDYAGTQACRALKEEGIETVLVNSNPATIMTDKDIADIIYIEPINADVIKKIILKEKPDSVLATLGGQTGLNLCMELADEGFLQANGVNIIGASSETIKKAEDRLAFKQTMESIGEPCVLSEVVETLEDALAYAEAIEYPVVVRPAYTLGGTGGGIAYNREQLEEIGANGLRASRVHQTLIEKCISGWKEIEFEVIRDMYGNCITVCSMENIDPVGVHTGDSIVVAPAQTLADREYQMLRSSALNIINALGIQGGCNVQFALDPYSFEYAVIEVNPRVSRSSALASKAAGYPIAKVVTKIALGYALDEIKNAITGNTYASFEPTLDYMCLKIPKWPFDKFVTAARTLGTQMKATGEVMSISHSFEGALMKALRSLEQGIDSLMIPWVSELGDSELKERLTTVDDSRLFVIAEALRRGIGVEEICRLTTIDPFFVAKIRNVIEMEKAVAEGMPDKKLLLKAKKMGFPDSLIARLTGKKEGEIRSMRLEYGIKPAYHMVDTCAAEFDAQTPYYYSCYDESNEAKTESDKKKVIVFGSGPIRIGQGIEFDYCSVHCVWALREMGYETIIINNNPETVSTDFDISDKLYFEPLTKEDVWNIIDLEKPCGVVVQFGGQTAIKLAGSMAEIVVPILGTSAENVDNAEDRQKFDEILEQCGVIRPEGGTVFTTEEAINAANELTYPVLLRPSYVLGGQGMRIAFNDEDIVEFMSIINRTVQEHPILIDKYVMGREVEVDAICDGKDVLIPGIMEHVERAGVHSGDSISVYPPENISEHHKQEILDITRKLARALDVRGLLNIQFIIHDDTVYVIEVNPRSSRTVPYISKITDLPIVKISTQTLFGKTLEDLGYNYGLHPEKKLVAVKLPVFSSEKLFGAEISLGPEMKSTGEVLGLAENLPEALTKAFLGSGVSLPKNKKLIITVKDSDKQYIGELCKGFISLGYEILATEGTHIHLSGIGIDSRKLNKISEGAPTILDEIRSGSIDLVIDTPTFSRDRRKDGFLVRRNSVEMRIPCLTSLDTANALLMSMEQTIGKDLDIIDIAQI